MRTVIAIIVLLLVVGPVQATDTGLEFNGAKYQPEDSTVKNTYKLPNVDGGFVYDSTTNRIRAVLSFEAYDNIKTGLNYPIKINTGVAEDLAFTSATVRFTSIIEFSGGLYMGYDINTESSIIGPIFLITRF